MGWLEVSLLAVHAFKFRSTPKKWATKLKMR